MIAWIVSLRDNSVTPRQGRQEFACLVRVKGVAKCPKVVLK